MAERRTKLTDDLTSALLDAEIDGDRLTDEEVLGFMFLMVIAGNETTTKFLANAAFWAASPTISNRIPEDFPDPDSFRPDRYNKPEQADTANRWTWIPFGAGRHRCVGAAFAQMQIKAIFSVLLGAGTHLVNHNPPPLVTGITPDLHSTKRLLAWSWAVLNRRSTTKAGS